MITFNQLLLENASVVMYHKSPINPVIIMKHGLKVSKKNFGKTWDKQYNVYVDRGWYSGHEIFLATGTNVWSGMAGPGFIYAVDVNGLKMIPDYPTLQGVIGTVFISQNGKIVLGRDEDVTWKEFPQCLQRFSKHGIGKLGDEKYRIVYVTKQDLDSNIQCCVATTQSVAISGPIPPDRILSYKKFKVS